MGAITNALKSVASRMSNRKAAVYTTQSVGQTSFNRGVTGTLTPTVGFSAPVQKGPSIANTTHMSGIATNGHVSGEPKT